MRILVIHSRYRWPGGEEATVERLVGALRSSGHDVAYHEVENPRDPIQSIANAFRAPWNHPQYQRVSGLIDDFRPDVAHVHNTWFALSPSVIAACAHRSVPVVTTVHNYRTVCPQGQLFRKGQPCTDCVGRFAAAGLRHRCYRGSVALTAVNVATTALNAHLGTWSSIKTVHIPSEFTKRVLLTGPFNESRFVVFPNAAPDPGLRRTPPSASDRVLFVGRLSPEKGLDLVLDAWRRVRPAHLKLEVVGDGPAHQAWEVEAPIGVEFLGRLSRHSVSRAMLTARALVFPSRSFEVCPMVVVEALAAGLPVFAHDLGATPELLTHSIDDVLIPFGAAYGWDEALDTVTEDSIVDALGDANRRAYLERHTIEGWLSAHEAMYRATLTS